MMLKAQVSLETLKLVVPVAQFGKFSQLCCSTSSVWKRQRPAHGGTWQRKGDEFIQILMRSWSCVVRQEKKYPGGTDRMRQQRRAAGTRSLGEAEEQTTNSMIILCFYS